MTQTDEPAANSSDVRRAEQPTASSRPKSAGSTPSSQPRVELEACLRPGRADSRRLLITWFVKKSFWWMFFGGTALASTVHFVERVENEFQVNYRSPESVEHGILSVWVFVVLAVLLRLAIPFVATGLAYPLARAHEVGLAPRTGWNRQYAQWSDRYKVAKSFRTLRWTHHVRQVALDRVSPGPGWWRRLDPIIDIANVVGVAAFILTGVTLAAVDVTELMI